MSDDNMKKDPLTQDPLLDHEYDGIKELANPLPGWWVGCFYLTIIFGIGYVMYYHLFDGPSIDQEFRRGMDAHIYAQYEREQASGGKKKDLSFLASWKDDPSKLELGAKVYKVRCVSCHMEKGQGSIGPNLTDNFWLHGDGSLESIYAVVDKGVAAKGMPPWGPILKDEELGAVTAFLGKLKGTNVAGKGPQGEEIK